MSRAPEAELVTQLQADTTLMALLNAIYEYVPQRTDRAPFAVVSLLSDNNEKKYLSYYGGSADVQIDIYSKHRDGYSLRAEMKDALRRIRGVSGEIKITSVVVTNEQTFGLEDTGLYRQVIDTTVNYTEV
jgi:hypothetical protein